MPTSEESDRTHPVLWLVIAGLLVVAVNAAGFALYADTHQGKSLLDELWAYLESETARVITIGAGIPLIVLLLERHFRVRERSQQQEAERIKEQADEQRARDSAEQEAREVRRKELLEDQRARESVEREAQEVRRRELVEDQRARARTEREARIETMQQTLDLWRQLLDTGYVIVYTSGADRDDDVANALEQRVRGLLNSITPVVSAWHYRFTNLERPTIDLLHEALETFLRVVDAVLLHMQETPDAAVHAELKAYLGTILVWMLRPLRSFVEVMGASIADLESQEAPGTDTREEQPSDEMLNAVKGLTSRVEQVRIASTDDTPLVRRVLPLLSDNEAAAVGPAYEDWLGWLRVNKKLPSSRWPGFADLEERVAELPVGRIHQVRAMSREDIKAIADRCMLLLHAERLRTM